MAQSFIGSLNGRISGAGFERRRSWAHEHQPGRLEIDDKAICDCTEGIAGDRISTGAALPEGQSQSDQIADFTVRDLNQRPLGRR